MRQQKAGDAATVPRIVHLPVAVVVVSRDPNKRSFGRSLVECASGPVRVTRGCWRARARAPARAHSKRMWVSAGPISCVFEQRPSRCCWLARFDSV